MLQVQLTDGVYNYQFDIEEELGPVRNKSEYSEGDGIRYPGTVSAFDPTPHRNLSGEQLDFFLGLSDRETPNFLPFNPTDLNSVRRGSENVFARWKDPILSPAELMGSCIQGVHNVDPSVNHIENNWEEFDHTTNQQLRKNWLNYLSYYAANFSSVQSTFKGRGIVIVSDSGDSSVWRIYTQIQLLRHYGTNLPIEIHYTGSNLNYYSISLLANIPEVGDIRFRNLSDPVANIIPAKGPSQSLRTLAIINSVFEEIIFLDSDTIPLNDLTVLLDTFEYWNTGVLFWPNFWRTHPNSPIWEIANVPCDNSEFEVDPGQMVIDKRRMWEPLLLANYWAVSEFSSISRLMSDIGSILRFAWKALRLPFWIGKFPTSVGFALNSSYCGHSLVQYHPDGRPFFLHSNKLKQFSYELVGFYTLHPNGLYQLFKQIPHLNSSDEVWADISLWKKEFEGIDGEVECVDIKMIEDGSAVVLGSFNYISDYFTALYRQYGGYDNLDVIYNGDMINSSRIDIDSEMMY